MSSAYFEGNLTNNHHPGSNPIAAYTFLSGNSPKDSWISAESANLNVLVDETKKHGKKKTTLLLGLIGDAGLRHQLALYRPGTPRFDGKLRIHLYDGQNKLPFKIISFWNISLKEPKPGEITIYSDSSRKRVARQGKGYLYTIDYTGVE